MFQFLRNKYLIAFLFIYLIAVAILHFRFLQPVSDSLSFALLFGCCFPFIAWIMVRKCSPYPKDKPAFNKEIYILTGLVLLIVWYISYGTGWINNLVFREIQTVPWKNSFFILLKKFIVFVLLPFFIYRSFGFDLRDFGFAVYRPGKKWGKTFFIFVVLALAISVFQLFWGRGGEAVRRGDFSFSQLIIGLPFCFTWYFIEVGLVEEFFFRALLQSRISILLKSGAGGILISGLIFGLAHAPGLFLRGASSEGVGEQLPFIFWAAYTVSVMSLAGIFLGIVWSKTKNIYLVMAIHAIVDLLPNLGDFIQTWQIK